jgi:hypothetical protein
MARSLIAVGLSDTLLLLLLLLLLPLLPLLQLLLRLSLATMRAGGLLQWAVDGESSERGVDARRRRPAAVRNLSGTQSPISAEA